MVGWSIGWVVWRSVGELVVDRFVLVVGGVVGWLVGILIGRLVDILIIV